MVYTENESSGEYTASLEPLQCVHFKCNIAVLLMSSYVPCSQQVMAKRPVSAVGNRRPITEYAKMAAAMGGHMRYKVYRKFTENGKRSVILAFQNHRKCSQVTGLFSTFLTRGMYILYCSDYPFVNSFLRLFPTLRLRILS